MLPTVNDAYISPNKAHEHGKRMVRYGVARSYIVVAAKVREGNHVTQGFVAILEK